MNMLRAALLQMSAGIDPAANALAIEDAMARAAEAGATLFCTPEMSNLIDRDRTRAASHIVAEGDDEVLRRIRAAAAKYHLWVLIGSLAVRHEGENGKYANRSFLIDDTGAIRARYDKMHLFDVDLASGESWRESNAYAAGNTSIVGDTPWGGIGLSICYDVRFPALYQALSAAGANILSIPAAFTVPTGLAHWETLLRARAIENACFVIATAQTGLHEDGRETYGHSCVIDPWGEILLSLGEEQGLGIVDLPLDRIDDIRARIPVIAHRRPIPTAQVTK
ncbi:carbon-nitrogen hydrolase family protein [Aquisediminimonas sediminicola]|uniref:carbon-nitrogen hydrolase family protein n=1 Tax=Alteraquisediminimonas sediminicola TaxID=2676787 RepID=UPI001C8E657E|nr:carbon-nitrogen hydrolase family protein [Aquisediminimonas sediminicola]